MDNQHDMIKAVYEDGEATINGNVYEIKKPPFRVARSVFAYLTKTQSQMTENDFSFIDSDDFMAIEKIINRHVLVEGVQLEKESMKGYWDDHQADYIMLIGTALATISYPFMPASAGN